MRSADNGRAETHSSSRQSAAWVDDESPAGDTRIGDSRLVGGG
ncbi:MAG TPA: hypothetical protein VE891_15305 [Allosphingosinicella sp.]|nr:hypothetical protein [Allosphingosinicella sp.]